MTYDEPSQHIVVVVSQDSFIPVHIFDDANSTDKSDEVSILCEDNLASIDDLDGENLLGIVEEGGDEEVALESMHEYIYRKGYSPYWNEDTQTWWQYDHDLYRYVDTGVSTTNVTPIPIPEIDALWFEKEYVNG